MPKPPPASLVRIDEMARRLSVSVRTLENWIQNRRVSVIRIGGVNLFDPDQVIQDVKRFEVPALEAESES